MTDEQVRARLTIRGRVQGVFFRQSAAEQARARGLAGWVRNRSDGAVEAVFQGPRDAVEEMLGWCQEGPRYARVDQVEIAWEDLDLAAGSFEIGG